MKKIFTIAAALLMTASAWAQAPEKMSYQAVVRNTSNNLVTSQSVGMKISILKGAVTGTAVYVETQTPTTNNNGLVSLEVGTGTVVSGNFSAIDWSNNTYFIKTETDPAGGTTYTITGTNQLLSVPYALHSKTADSITGGETDPVFGASVASGVTAIDTAYWNKHSEESRKYAIGDFAHGGIVFWVDETKEHGIVCAKEDQKGPMRWYAKTKVFGITQAKGDGPLAGKANTSIIIAALVAIGDDNNPYAARICNELQITEGKKTYGDWYLPSKEELNLMYVNMKVINTTADNNKGGKFTLKDSYWSSTEYSGSKGSNVAYGFHFGKGKEDPREKQEELSIRAVRTF